MVKTRVITSIVLIPIVWLAVMFNGRPLPWFTMLMALWCLLALFEFYRLVRHSGTAIPHTLTGMVLALVIIIQPHFDSPYLLPGVLTLAVIGPMLIELCTQKQSAMFGSWVWTVGGIMYLGWLSRLYVALSLMDEGKGWIMLALMVTFTSDVCAFFIGRSLGRYKLAPSISPRKTWEGAVGGAVGAVVAGLIVVQVMHLPVQPLVAILLSLAVSIMGQLGDLMESMFKRRTGAKDASHAIPGHGGFLDRFDSVVFAGLVVYFYVVFFQ